ncbi:MAG: anaerobic ribonucleoside-triphosphate reductase [Bacilli bacterium]
MKKNTKPIFETLIVVKRSGQRVLFNKTKIAVAIKHAFDSVSIYNEKDINKVFEDVLFYIKETYELRKTINVEDIQDIIENKLQENKFIDVFQSFNEYRIQRAESRKAFSAKQQHKFVKAIEKIAKTNPLKSENNLKPLNTLIGFGKTVSNEFTKAYLLDTKFVRNHEEGTIYIHDLDYFGLGIFHALHLKFNLDSILPSDLPFKLLNILFDSIEEVSGFISIDSLDYLLSDWVIKTYKETYKETLNNYLTISGYLNYLNIKKIEELIDKENNFINDLSLFNAFILNEQVKKIFEKVAIDTNLKLEKNISSTLKNILISLNNNGKENKKYNISLGTNETEIGIFINQLFLKELDKLPYLENVALIFKIKDKSLPNIIDRVTNLIIKQKNIAISFIKTSYNNDLSNEIEYFSNGERIFENIYSENKESTGRIIIATTSVNLSRLAFKYSYNKLADFYKELDEILELVKNELLFTFETMGDKNKDNYKALFNDNILDDEKLENNQKIRKVIKNGTLNIGLVGLKEAVINMSSDIDKQKELMLKILKHINELCQQFSRDNKVNFCLRETNEEKPLQELMALDKTIYGFKEHITTKDKYEIVNCINLDDDLNLKLKFIGKYQKLLSGGSLFEIIIPKNITAKRLTAVLQMMWDCDIGFVKFVGVGEKNEN